MPGIIAPHRATLEINRLAILWLYPRLRGLPPETWESLLGKARETNLETAEWVGIIGGIAFVAWLLGVEPAMLSTQPPLVLHLLRFVLALPLLSCVVGPFYLRRTRRGLDRELLRMKIHTADTQAHPDRKEA